MPEPGSAAQRQRQTVFVAAEYQRDKSLRVLTEQTGRTQNVGRPALDVPDTVRRTEQHSRSSQP